MAIFDFLKKKKMAENDMAKKDHGNPTVWECADAIFIGDQHVSGMGMHISCEVKYFPSNREVVCRTTSTSDATPRYESLVVPAEINTADGLIAFIISEESWLGHGYKLSDKLRKRLDVALMPRKRKKLKFPVITWNS